MNVCGCLCMCTQCLVAHVSVVHTVPVEGAQKNVKELPSQDFFGHKVLRVTVVEECGARGCGFEI